MAIGTLDRTKLDEAVRLAAEQAARKEQFGARVTAEFDEIDAKREEILMRSAAAVDARNVHVQARSGVEETIKDVSTIGKAAEQEFHEAEAELARLTARVEELQAAKIEAKANADAIQEKAARIEAALANQMGEADLSVPNPDVAVPELSTEVQAWASKFIKLEQKETKEYFEAESARIGAILDVRRIDLDIAACQERIATLRDEIPQMRAKIEELVRVVTAARAQKTQMQDAVEQAQAQVDAIKEELSALNHSAVLYDSLGRFGDALTAAVIAAHLELKDEVTRILSEINAASNPDFVKKTRKAFDAFKADWGKASSAFKAITMRAPLVDKLGDLQACYDQAQDVATKFDAFVDGDLLKSANNSRIRNLNSATRDVIAPEVATRLNGEESRQDLHVNASSLYIDGQIIKDVAAAAAELDPFSLEVPEHLYDPLREALEAVYGRLRAGLIKAALESAANTAELERLAALDSVGEEPEFAGLKKETRDATISKFKSKPESEATAEFVRAELRDALSHQNTPTYARWCKILNLPVGGKAFLPAASFTDGEGEVYKTHISFFSNCFGPAVDRGISLMKSGTEKYSPGEVMDLLFVSGKRGVLRVHASIELKNNDGDQPHVFYKHKNGLHFRTTFEHKVQPVDPHDTGWERKAINHARTQLQAHMGTLQRRVKAWLDKDGAV